MNDGMTSSRRSFVYLGLAPLPLLMFLLAITTMAQNSVPAQRSPLDATNWGVVYDMPATKQIKVRHNVPYLGTLAVDIYSPPDLKEGEKRPTVVFINAIGDRGDDKVKNWAIYQSWPRLVAAHGLIGVSMDTDGTRVQESLRGTHQYLTGEHAAKGIRAGKQRVFDSQIDA